LRKVSIAPGRGVAVSKHEITLVWSRLLTPGFLAIINEVGFFEHSSTLSNQHNFLQDYNFTMTKEASAMPPTAKANGDTNGSTSSANGTTQPISIALSPNDPDNIAPLVDNIAELAKASPVENNDSRLKLLAQARSLVQALETPRETMIKHCWAEVMYTETLAPAFI